MGTASRRRHHIILQTLEPDHDIELDIPATASRQCQMDPLRTGRAAPVGGRHGFRYCTVDSGSLVERAAAISGLSHVRGPAVDAVVREKLQRMGFETIPEKGMSFLSGVVQGLYASVIGLTGPDDDVLTMTPIYPPFLSAITAQGRPAHGMPHWRRLPTDGKLIST